MAKIKAEAHISINTGTIALPVFTFLPLYIQFVNPTLLLAKFIKWAQKQPGEECELLKLQSTLLPTVKITKQAAHWGRPIQNPWNQTGNTPGKNNQCYSHTRENSSWRPLHHHSDCNQHAVNLRCLWNSSTFMHRDESGHPNIQVVYLLTLNA